MSLGTYPVLAAKLSEQICLQLRRKEVGTIGSLEILMTGDSVNIIIEINRLNASQRASNTFISDSLVR